MTAEALARVPRTIADLLPGDHLCGLYQTEEEHRAVVTPFLRHGLEGGEKVVYIVDDRTAETVGGYLRDDGLDPAPFLASGQLVFLTSGETYLREGAFDPEGMIGLLRSGEARALADGYRALRVTGEMTWALRGPTDPAALVRYEVLLNTFFPGSACLAICQYDRRRIEPGLLLEIVQSHPYVVIGADVCLNPHYVPPESFFSEGRPEAQLAGWIHGLLSSARREDAIRDASIRLERVIAGTGAATWETNLLTGESSVDERWAEILGYTLAELDRPGSRAWRDLAHPDDLAHADDLLRRHCAGELPEYRCEVRMRHRDGRWIWVESRGRVLSRTDDGRPFRVFGTHVDISDRKAADEELRTAYGRLSQIINVAVIGVLVARADGSVADANDRYLDIIGFTREEFERGEVNWREITPPEWLAADERALGELREHGTCEPYEKEYLRRDGRRVPVLLADAMLPGGGDEIAAFAVDLTERKQAERALEENRALLRAIVDGTPDAIYAKNLEGCYTLFNAGAQAVTGKNEDEVMGRDDTFLFPADDAALVMARDRAVMAGGVPTTYEERVTAASGRAYTFLSTKGPIRDASGNVTGLFGIARDISDRRATEILLATQADVLALLAVPAPVQETVERIVDTIRRRLDLDAVGIRLASGDDYPFAASAGYSDAFLAAESSLAIRLPGGICRSRDESVQLACTCGLVLSGRPHALATPGGSVWTNASGRILALAPDEDPRLQPRNRCFHEGFESVMIAPIRSGSQTRGLLHVADRRPDRLSVDTVAVLESIGASIGAALERREIEAALRQSEDQYRRLFEAASDPVFVIDPDTTRILDANGMTSVVYGYEHDELLAMSSPDVSAEPERTADFIRTATGYGDETQLTGRRRHRRKDGTTFPVEFSARIVTRDDRTVLLVACRDVTDREAAEEALRESEQRFRTVFEQASVGATLTDLGTGMFVEVNERFAEIVGRTREEAAAAGWISITHPDDLAADLENVRRITSGETSGYRMAKRYLKPDGSAVWVDLTVTVVRAGDPARRLALAIVEDVTERRAAEAAVHQSRAELAEAQRIAHVGSWTFDPGTGGATWSDELFRIFGLEPGGPAPTLAEQEALHPPEAYARVCRQLAATAATGDPYEIEYDITRADDISRHLVERGEAVRGDDGSVIGVRGTLSDITELHQALERADRAQRAEMVGRLAGGVAHDFNNLLTAVGGYAELLAESMAPEDPRRDDVDAIRAAGARAATLTRQLLAFGRRETLQPVTLRVPDAVDGLSKILRSLVPADVNLVVRHTDGDASAHVDRSHLQQAVVNLVLNARDAMPRGGTLTIETGSVRLEAGDPRGRPPVPPGTYVSLAITDTGTGIPPESLPHLFEPFFTTKPFGKGSGLGLSSLDGFVAMSGGFVTVASTVGEGSTFTIHLPAVTPVEDARETTSSVSGAPRGSETILLVDDEPGVRAITARLVRGLGYTVREASNPVEALAIAQSGEGVDLLLTDVVMPGMNGPELASRLRRLRPGLPIALMSAYAPEAVIGDEGEDAWDAFLSKPFERDVLAARLRELLDRPNPADPA